MAGITSPVVAPDDGAGLVQRQRRWPSVLPLLILLAVLTASAFLGGTWVFAGRIAADALAVEDPDPEFDVEVVAVGNGTVTFAAAADSPPDLYRDDLLGFACADGGYGHLGRIVSATPTELSRTFDHLVGPPLGTGGRVELDGLYWPPEPAVLGIEHTAVNYESSFGEFDAWFVPGSRSTWVVFVHGRGSHMREGLRILPTLAAAGHPTLLISYRNDEGQPANGERQARFGATEWEDLEAAVRYAVDNGASDVVLVGYSMGGAIATSFMYESQLATSVRGLILDAPALDFEAIIDAGADEENLPLLPVRVPPPMVWSAKLLASLRYDIDWNRLDYLDERVARLDVPILLFHGTDDETVPISVSDELAAVRPDLVTYEVFAGAGHVRAWNVDPDRYESAVRDFLASL